eukprot:CAMPEP_0177691702 /NCGR_PEP_ID=MMETSP0484_2-20121128/1453_1 /TAXON_ID=354590 /ORGANISM="Rhodomonas lens, Strain RHODO" /LENGTH=346 /DNA_ID=CAMNT_0019202355 /DNA_START=208 /DNA_END=1245 /DNA_ORIENTATION=+
MSNEGSRISDDDRSALEDYLETLEKPKQLITQQRLACTNIEHWIVTHRLLLAETCNANHLKFLGDVLFEIFSKTKLLDSFFTLVRTLFLPDASSGRALPHTRKAIKNLFNWADDVMEDNDAHFYNAAAILNEVLEVDMYRELPTVAWLTGTGNLFLDSLLVDLNVPNYTHDQKKKLRISFGIVKSIARDLYRDSGEGEKLTSETVRNFFKKFKDLGAKLQKVANKDEDLFALYYVAVNEFLLSQALDFRGLALELFKQQHTWVRQNWSSFTQTLQTNVAQHLRILFCTGVLPEAGSKLADANSYCFVTEIFELMKSHKAASTSSGSPESQQGKLTDDERVVVELFA